MKLNKIAKWLAIAALLGLALSGIAFQQAAIVIDGETLSIQELLSRGCEINY